MNTYIPSNNYETLWQQLSLDDILDNIYQQIDTIKTHPLYNSNNTKFELEFRLRNKYAKINVTDYVNENCCEYQEYLYNENKNTRYRIICNSQYLTNKEQNNTISDENKNQYFDISKLCDYIDRNKDMEITETLDQHIEYTKKLTLISAYYFIFKVVLSIETSLDISNVIEYVTSTNENSYSNKELQILQFITPTIKKRRSFIIHKDVRLDFTMYDDTNQFEIDFSQNMFHEKIEITNIIHNIMSTLDASNFILDYLFVILPNFEFQKPITPSLDILFRTADELIHHTFFVAAKTDGLRRILIIINQLVFSISENFSVTFIDYIGKIQDTIVLDCEYINDNFIPFDILYYNSQDLRNARYSERIAILNSLNFDCVVDLITKKDIKHCKAFADLQEYIAHCITKSDLQFPNDGVIITDANSTYFENTKVLKIKTINTVDLRFDGRYFYVRNHLVKKSVLDFSISEYKKICLLYNKHKKINYKKDIVYYRKYVDIQDNERIVKYQLVREKKVPFIIEVDINTKTFVKERKDKWTTNSLNTFNSVLLASLQKIDIDIFSSSSNILMRKYHNIIKQNILNNYKGKLIDIGSGNGGDIHKWKHFRKIVCVEPDLEKIKNLNQRVSKSDIKNRITIIQDNIQSIKIKDTFNIASCFFALNDFTYTDIENMLSNINKNIKGSFIILFFDNNLFKEDIDSPCIKYKQCIHNNQISDLIDKFSPVYLISTLRYIHKNCDNVMFVDINNSNLTNHYENAINSDKLIEIFEKFNFKVIKQYSVTPLTLLNPSQQIYTSYLKVIEFSNIII